MQQSTTDYQMTIDDYTDGDFSLSNLKSYGEIIDKEIKSTSYDPKSFDKGFLLNCLYTLEDNRDGKQIYEGLKLKKLMQSADRTNESFNKLVDEICNIIETADTPAMLNRIARSIKRLNELSEKVYFYEEKYIKYI